MKTDIATQMKVAGLPGPELEWKYHPARKWAFDWAWPALKVAAEREGGTWKDGGGRHNRAAGFREDAVKYDEAAILGWLVIRFTSDMEASGVALDLIERALKARGWNPQEKTP